MHTNIYIYIDIYIFAISLFILDYTSSCIVSLVSSKGNHQHAYCNREIH